MIRRMLVCLVAVLLTLASGARAAPDTPGVTRATLENGLRVIIVRDPLAPVATIEDNYLVGENETPVDRPGLAHAQEHMAFRGCAGVSADQIAAIYARLGGYGNADTQQNVTQYFTTVPALDLGVALRVDAACMQQIQDAGGEWQQERGAIEQEVARDLSDPTYRFLTRLNGDMFAGTPYARDALGTKASFDATTESDLKAFERQWYVPNNAVLVITGNVDPAATLATVKSLYGAIARRPLPPRPTVSLPAVTAETFSLESNLPYELALLAYRLPGTGDKDFAAAEVLADVLDSQRGTLYGLVPAGQALAAGFQLGETYTRASVGFAIGALPSDGNAPELLARMRQIINHDVTTGLPADLVEAAKRRELATADFARASIPGLADAWSEAVAVEGRASPDEDVAAIQAVTPDDVNRLAKTYLLPANAVTATLVPKPGGVEPPASKGFGGSERTTQPPSGPVELPAWAAADLDRVAVPAFDTSWTDHTLLNKLRVIVKTERTSPTVTVMGVVHHDPRLQARKGQDGVDDVLEDLFSYGTTDLDRLAFQQALDQIGAVESAGAEFSIRVPAAQFSRAVALLAQNELHPALPEKAFETVQTETARFVAGQMTSPGYLADVALRERLLPAGDPALREPTPGTIDGLTLDDVRAFYRETFRPDLTTIVVIGDVTADEAVAAVTAAFGDWTATGPTPGLLLPKVPPNGPAVSSVTDQTAVQSSVTLAEELGLTRFDPDYYPLQLGNHVLGGGFYATRLYHDLREVSGLVYTVDTSLSATRTRALYGVSYGCDPANVARARDLIVRDVAAMQTQPVGAAQLQQAKALLLRQLPLSESSEDDVAQGLLGRAELGLPLDEPARAARRYAALTAADVEAAFKKWIRPDGFVEVVSGPSSTGPGLPDLSSRGRIR